MPQITFQYLNLRIRESVSSLPTPQHSLVHRRFNKHVASQKGLLASCACWQKEYLVSISKFMLVEVELYLSSCFGKVKISFIDHTRPPNCMQWPVAKYSPRFFFNTGLFLLVC